MKKSFTVARALAFVSVAAVLAGCKSATLDSAPNMTSDYRLRHPIAVREKVQSLTVFIGDARGTLTPTQRAEVCALASSWRREATGGIVIDVPAGSPNERSAARATRESRSILSAAGVPHHAVDIRPYPAQDPVRLGTIRVNYPRMAAETGPCGLWPNDIGPTTDPSYWANKAAWNHGCANQRN